MSREALVLLVCCCDFRDGAERLIPSKSLRNAVIRAFPGLFRILRMCAPRRAAAVVRPRGREKSADRRRRILISRLLIIRASVPRRKSPFPAYFKGFPAVSPLIPPYPAFLKYPVSPQKSMVILQAIQDFGNWFWGIPILILIGGGGLFLTIYLGFPQIRHFGYAMSQTFGKMFAKKEEGKVRPISAAFAALACAVGASNIVGVPVAIALGGPGAVFWIWILAILGMCTKYCEVAMGIKYRRKNDVGEWVGGPAYYLRGLGKKIGVVFGVGYAFFFMIELVPSLASQGVSAAEQFNVFGANQTVTGIIIAVLVGVILAGGFKRVSSVTDILVPVMACLYVLGALIIIFANVGEIPAVFGMIFQDAFTGRAAVGGFAGATIMAAIRWGAARGVYSNEAGVGSTIAGHCTADTDHPIRQAQFGIFEVFMDTIVICTITALAVLASGVWTQEGLSSGQLALAAFQSVFGSFGAIFVAVTVFLFVFSTIISAGFFGQIQAEILFGRKFSKIWVFMYPLFIGIACAFSNVTTMYMITDGFMAIIVILNMIGLLLMCKQVKDLQKEYYNTPGMYYLADKAAKEAKKAAK